MTMMPRAVTLGQSGFECFSPSVEGFLMSSRLRLLEVIGRPSLERALGVDDIKGSEWGATRWKTLLVCPREYFYRYLEGKKTEEPVPNLALDFGKAWHLALSFYYYARGVGLSAEEALKRALEVPQRLKEVQGFVEDAEQLETALELYFERYGDEEKDMRVLDVEVTLSAPLYGRKYTARLDLVVEHRGQVWVVEHKTDRSVTMHTFDRYELDPQILGQLWLTGSYTGPWRFAERSAAPVGVIVNIMAKTKVPQFLRLYIARSCQHRGIFLTHMGWVLQLERMARDRGWPRNIGACVGSVRFFRPCPYLGVCKEELGTASDSEGKEE